MALFCVKYVVSSCGRETLKYIELTKVNKDMNLEEEKSRVEVYLREINFCKIWKV